MKLKKCIALALAGALWLLLMSGCVNDNVTEKQKVSVAMWSDQLTENYAEYLQTEFPDVEFEFYAITNSTDFYRFKQEHDDLPDILTVRRFSLNDVKPLKGSLMDLSDSELANMFYQPYLRNYTYSDGTVNWLPACAEVDSILINKTLLDEHGLEIPENYGEFTELCGKLKELGIRPFRSDFGADYTCMEILQGLSVSQLTSAEGRMWRQQYESGQTEQLSEEVWLPVFRRMLEFIECAGVVPSDTEGGLNDVYAEYKAHKVAMIRGTAAEARLNGVEDETVLMPYFGDTSEDNWYLTYPAFQAAANVKAENDPVRKELILNIMTAMLGENGLKSITSGENMISYTKSTELEFSPMLNNIRPYIENNQLYIRLASSEMFSSSKQVVQKMVSGECTDARSAFDEFNATMLASGEDEPAAAHIDKGYSYAFDPECGSPAASAVMNTVREELGTRLLVGQSINTAGNIAEGDYTESELKFLTMGESVEILLCDMTAEQLEKYLEYVLNVRGKRGSVANDSALYVSSGFEMEIKKTGRDYSITKLTVNGAEMDSGETYSAAVIGNEFNMQKDALAAAGITDYTKSDAVFKQIVADRLAGGGKLAEPADYITLKY